LKLAAARRSGRAASPLPKSNSWDENAPEYSSRRAHILIWVVIVPAFVELTALLMSDDPLERMRARIAQCRRLAASTTDARTRDVLLQMAEEGEVDLKRLAAERAERDEPPQPKLDQPPPTQS